MIDVRLNNFRVGKSSTVFYENPKGDVKVNINQNMPAFKDNDTETVFSMSFELLLESEIEKPEKSFYVYIEVFGNYSLKFDNQPDLEELGYLLRNDLFPYLRSSVATIMASVGMPSFIIPISIFDSENVRSAATAE